MTKQVRRYPGLSDLEQALGTPAAGNTSSNAVHQSQLCGASPEVSRPEAPACYPFFN